MSNPPRKKGTAGETELLRLLNAQGFSFVRNPAGARTDLRHRAAYGGVDPFRMLATRPDRGKWLITMSLEDFSRAFTPDLDNIELEVKRRKTFAHHTMFEDELA